VHNVLIEGQESPGTLVGTNLISGIYTEGWFGGNPDPLTGSFIVERSTFRVMGDPFPYSTVDGFRGRFVDNTIEGVFGVSGGDLANASVEYKDNTIESVLGIWLYNVGILPYGVQTSDILVRNNRLSGVYGAFFEATFGPDVRCRLIRNDTKQTENGLFLGAGESVCKVAGRDAHRERGGDRDEAVSRLLAPLKTLRGRS
jgi:hypothetical protein